MQIDKEAEGGSGPMFKPVGKVSHEVDYVHVELSADMRGVEDGTEVFIKVQGDVTEVQGDGVEVTEKPATPAELWGDFIDYLHEVDPLGTMEEPKERVRFLNAIKKYRDLFFEATKSNSSVLRTKAINDVLSERRHQIEEAGNTFEREDTYTNGSLVVSGACYALCNRDLKGEAPVLWPWDTDVWTPESYRRNLVKAAALILAEIERLDRAEAKAREEVSKEEERQQLYDFYNVETDDELIEAMEGNIKKLQDLARVGGLRKDPPALIKVREG